jgi:hypothetical protein
MLPDFEFPIKLLTNSDNNNKQIHKLDLTTLKGLFTQRNFDMLLSDTEKSHQQN